MRSIIWQPIRHHDRRGGPRGQGRRAGVVSGVLEPGVRTACVRLFHRRFGGGPASGGFHRPGCRASDRDRAKGRRYTQPNPCSHKVREEIALRASSATGISRDTLAKMLPSHRFDDLRRSCEIHGKSGVWRDAGATRQRRRTGRSWPDSRPNIGRRARFRQPAAAASRAGSGWRAGRVRLHSRPDIGRRAEPMGPGQPPSAAPGPAGGGQGGLGGILGSILGILTSRPGVPPGTGPTGPAAPSGSPQVPGFVAASIQAGLEALTKMLQPGTSPPTGLQSGINAEIDQIMGGKRH
jgi:hypothetical protein